jgi:competence protein ComEC
VRPQEGAVVEGMVLRDASRIPEELEEAFRRSGITHVLAISGQHVAVLSAIIYFVLRLFAVPALFRNPTTLALMWLYIFVAGAPPSAIRAGFVATFVLAARSSGASSRLCTVRSDSAVKVRFFVTLDEEAEVEVV